MSKESSKIVLIFVRYFVILLAALSNLYLFYIVFTPLTVYTASCLLSLGYPVYTSGSTIVANSLPIEIVEACVAGSAYYLLFLLNLAVPMPLRKRILSILFVFASFLVINILRIF